MTCPAKEKFTRYSRDFAVCVRRVDNDGWELLGSHEARGKSGARLWSGPQERAGRVHWHRSVGKGGQPVHSHQFAGARLPLNVLLDKINTICLT